MNKKPLYNALAAILYIIVLVVGMNLITKYEVDEGLASFVMPIILISLFTLSAAVMGYLFCLQPLRLYLDGKKDQGVKLFLKTVAIFAGLTFGIFILFYGIVILK